MIKISKSINLLEKYVQKPTKGLPEDIFYFVGRLTPYINVDLIIRCPINGVLLTWRNDKFPGKGYGLLPEKEISSQPFTEVAVDLIGPWTLKVGKRHIPFQPLLQ